MSFESHGLTIEHPEASADDSTDRISDYKDVSLTAEPETKRPWIVWLVGAQLVILFAPTVAWLWDRWTMSVWHHAHGLLILPVVGYLVWQELRSLRHLPTSSSAWGFVILVPALALHALDTGMHTQLLSAVALVFALPGLSLLFLGNERTKAILFPLCFAVFMLPIPLAVTEGLHLALRGVATVSSAFLLPLLGIPVFAEGTTIHIANASLQISDACSGFSTLYAAGAVACLTAYFCPDPRRQMLVLLLAAPIAIVANILRVVLLVLLVHWQGAWVLGTSLHTISGLFTFALVLPVIFWLGNGPTTARAKG